MMASISASMALLFSIRAIVSDFRFVATILCADAFALMLLRRVMLSTPFFQFFVLRLCFER